MALPGSRLVRLFLFNSSIKNLNPHSRKGSTQALASISGPIEVHLANENLSKATFEVTIRPLSSTPGTESKSLATTLRNLLTPSLLLTQNPRTMIQLVVQGMNASSGTGSGFTPGMTAAMVNASSLALLNTAVPMSGVVCAVAVGYSSSTKALVLDPPEEERCTGHGCFAFMFSVGGLVKLAFITRI
jgi:exosome complex component RRP46